MVYYECLTAVRSQKGASRPLPLARCKTGVEEDAQTTGYEGKLSVWEKNLWWKQMNFKSETECGNRWWKTKMRRKVIPVSEKRRMDDSMQCGLQECVGDVKVDLEESRATYWTYTQNGVSGTKLLRPRLELITKWRPVYSVSISLYYINVGWFIINTSSFLHKIQFY